MAKRKRTTTENTVARRLQQGRGQGNGASYRPWLTVQDVPSQGLTHRIKGWTTGRVHHLLSNLERDVFYVLDWSEAVLDIREQYPLLPLAETEALAQILGVRHPTDPRTHCPVVMSTDFLLDVRSGNTTGQQACTVKPADQLHARTLEKFEIERRYWQARGVDWGIVTEHEIPRCQVNTIRLLHRYRQIEQRLPSEDNLVRIVEFLCANESRLPVTELVVAADERLGLAAGTARTVLYHLLATRQIACNLSLPLERQVLL